MARVWYSDSTQRNYTKTIQEMFEIVETILSTTPNCPTFVNLRQK